MEQGIARLLHAHVARVGIEVGVEEEHRGERKGELRALRGRGCIRGCGSHLSQGWLVPSKVWQGHVRRTREGKAVVGEVDWRQVWRSWCGTSGRGSGHCGDIEVVPRMRNRRLKFLSPRVNHLTFLRKYDQRCRYSDGSCSNRVTVIVREIFRKVRRAYHSNRCRCETGVNPALLLPSLYVTLLFPFLLWKLTVC